LLTGSDVYARRYAELDDVARKYASHVGFLKGLIS
jgi:hypothetical protein